MSEAMRSAVRTSGPRLQISKMTPRPIDLGIMGDVGDETFEGGTSTALRYLVLVVLIAGALTAVYRLTMMP